MSTSKLAPIVAEVILASRTLFPPSVSVTQQLFLPVQIQPVWDFILRADKTQPGKAAEYPFEGIRTMTELNLRGCKLEGNK